MSKELIERLRKAGNYLREGKGSAIIANTVRQSIADAAFEAADALSLGEIGEDDVPQNYLEELWNGLHGETGERVMGKQTLWRIVDELLRLRAARLTNKDVT